MHTKIQDTDCKYRFHEHRDRMPTAHQFSPIMPETFQNRCKLRNHIKSDKKCPYPKYSHENCPIAKLKGKHK